MPDAGVERVPEDIQVAELDYGGRVELADFLAMAGLRLAPDAEVCTTSPNIDGKA
ncbi:hypothetical protein [Kitasatospora sp. MAP5-34]|uniref:hypothetical protein n=1 Tax=Kitasatospora sp. MAP5-34 TaxID=3035102 RepID=UPI002472FAE7|nr:hypothetical protein [Kitasatospora sp. MAP5-34]MDH6578233.1 hypothetical protein [Kitasatospora sp. MAP5-34]